jgi:integrase/recombinase XerD
MSIIDAHIIYLEHTKGHAISTVEKYRRYLVNLEKHLAESVPGKELLTATEDDLEAYTGFKAFKDGLSRSARRPMIACIKGFYAYLQQKRIRSDDPASSIPYPTPEKKIPIPMQLDSANKMINCIDLNTFMGVRDLAITMMLCGTGIRRSGLINLNESHLVTTVINEKGSQSERLFIRVMEKGSKERLLPAPVEVLIILRAYLAHPELESIDRTLSDGDKVLFVSMRNRRIPPHEYFGEARRFSARGVNKIFEKYGEIADIPKNQRHPHAMRHLFGAEMKEAEVDSLVLKDLMGHNSVDTTDGYGKLAVRLLAKEMARGNPLGKINTPVSGLAHLVK